MEGKPPTQSGFHTFRSSTPMARKLRMPTMLVRNSDASTVPMATRGGSSASAIRAGMARIPPMPVSPMATPMNAERRRSGNICT